MKQLTQQDLIELAKYIDDELSPKEREGLERRLATNELLQQKLTALLDVHQLMKSDTLPVPSRNFTQRVMENLDHYTPPVISFSITNGILLLIGVLIAGALALYLVRSGVFDGSVTVANPLHLSITENLFQQSLP